MLVFCISLILLGALAPTTEAYNVDDSAKAATVYTMNISRFSKEAIYAGYKITAKATNTTLQFVVGAPKFSPDSVRPYLSNGTVMECTANITQSNEETTLPITTTSLPFQDETTASEDFTDTTNVPVNSTEIPQSTASPDYQEENWTTPLTCQTIITSENLPKQTRHAQNSDRIGSSLSQLPGQSDYFVCAPGRQKTCNEFSFVPGACFGGNIASNMQWMTWNEKRCFQNFVDLMFVVDSSGSIDDPDFAKLKNDLEVTVSRFDGLVGNTMQVGMFLYGKNNNKYEYNEDNFYKIVFKLDQCNTVACMQTAIRNTNHQIYSSTFTATAIKRAVEIDFKKSIRKAESKKILVLITDGSANDKDRLYDSYRLTEQNGITVYAIGIGRSVKLDQLQISAYGDATISGERAISVPNFNSLSTTLNSLTQQISTSGSDGQVTTAAEETENSIFGFSNHLTQSGNVLVGAVGAYKNLGTIAHSNSQELATVSNLVEWDVVSQALDGLENQTLDSYLGYALTSGNYNGDSILYLAASAPRYMMVGAVAIFNESNLNTTYTLKPNYTQQAIFGSYFGGSLLSSDLNNDGMDDLLVGAPLFRGMSYDEGRVFVYISQGADTLNTWTNNYMANVLSGGSDVGGRFGTTMSYAGDLNNDGYNDIVISAPMADNSKGIVYVYFGSATGLSATYVQKITPSNFNEASLTNFGLSMERGLDVDGNSIPDLIIGAPSSDKVVVLRTRPLVMINKTLQFQTDRINILQCLNNPEKFCTTITACFSYDGKSVEPFLNVKYDITIDETLKRLFFKDSSSNVNSLSRTVALSKSKRVCTNYQVFVQKSITDFDTLIKATMSHSLTQSHQNKPVSSIEVSLSNKPVNASASVYKSCGENDTCLFGLTLSPKIELPEVFSESTNKSLTLHKTLIIGNDQPIRVKVNLSNNGDHAYLTKVFISYTKQLSFTKLNTLSKFNGNLESCLRDTGIIVTKGNITTKTFVYKQDDKLQSIMLSGSWCYFEFNFSTSAIKQKGDANVFQLQIEANSSQNSVKDGSVGHNNNWTDSYAIKYRTNYTSIRSSIEPVLVFNHTERISSPTSVFEIGVNTEDIVFENEVKGYGYSTVPVATISLQYPSRLDEYRPLLYLYKVECITVKGVVSCACDQSNVNPKNLSLSPPANATAHSTTVSTTTTNAILGTTDFFPYTNDDSNNTLETTESPAGTTTSSFTRRTGTLGLTDFSCNSSTIQKNFFQCNVLTCNVKDLGSQDAMRLRTYFRLGTSSLRLPAGVKGVTLKSTFLFKPFFPPTFIDDLGHQLKPIATEITTTANKYVPPLPIPGDLTWVYVVAAIGGFIILGSIVYFLYKRDFFRSQTEEEMEMEWENSKLKNKENKQEDSEI